MTNIVIIGQNESLYIEPMLESLKKFFGDSRRIWVLDRCTDNSEKKLKRYKEEYHITPSNLIGRQTSFARNYGLMFSNPKADIVFLDGDRFILQSGNLRDWKKDIALFTLEIDYRNNPRHEDGTLVGYNEELYGFPVNMFYSCGLYMKRKAIDKVTEFQNGELFSTEVQGQWGTEDLYLGDVCYHLGLSCDIHPDIRLSGRLNENKIPTGAISYRFRLRSKLNVRW